MIEDKDLEMDASLTREFDHHNISREQKATKDQIDAMRLGLQMRGQAYREVFRYDSPAGFTVLQDLAWVCRANRSLFVPEPLEMARRAGMHEVWLRINHHIELTPTQLVALYSDVFRKEGFGR